MKLERPLASFDLETTGLDISKDRIVEIAAVKLMPDGRQISKTARLNPGRPIPKEATEVHGITDEDVKDAPEFRRIAKSLCAFLSNCDLTGYNLARYDVPLLSTEFDRCGIKWPDKDVKIVDAYMILNRMESRDLAWALKFYCGADLVGAHSALPDAEATLSVLLEQARRYDAQDLDSLGDLQRDPNWVDSTGRFTKTPNGIAITFGKHKGTLLKDLGRSYLEWILDSSFPDDVKEVVDKELQIRMKVKR